MLTPRSPGTSLALMTYKNHHQINEGVMIILIKKAQKVLIKVISILRKLMMKVLMMKPGPDEDKEIQQALFHVSFLSYSHLIKTTKLWCSRYFNRVWSELEWQLSEGI